jgi:hypothetical protein
MEEFSHTIRRIKLTAKHRFNTVGVAGNSIGCYMSGGLSTTAHRILNTFSEERLHEASGIADE